MKFKIALNVFKIIDNMVSILCSDVELFLSIHTLKVLRYEIFVLQPRYYCS